MCKQSCSFYKSEESDMGLLEYYLLRSSKKLEGKNVGIYGIEVRKGTEMCAVWDISSDRYCVESLLDRLVRNDVTPMSLKDIVQDFVEVG